MDNVKNRSSLELQIRPPFTSAWIYTLIHPVLSSFLPHSGKGLVQFTTPLKCLNLGFA
jgi:hypothetical protein